jgi:hypothetical protein
MDLFRNILVRVGLLAMVGDIMITTVGDIK